MAEEKKTLTDRINSEDVGDKGLKNRVSETKGMPAGGFEQDIDKPQPGGHVQAYQSLATAGDYSHAIRDAGGNILRSTKAIIDAYQETWGSSIQEHIDDLQAINSNTTLSAAQKVILSDRAKSAALAAYGNNPKAMQKLNALYQFGKANGAAEIEMANRISKLKAFQDTTGMQFDLTSEDGINQAQKAMDDGLNAAYRAKQAHDIMLANKYETENDWYKAGGGKEAFNKAVQAEADFNKIFYENMEKAHKNGKQFTLEDFVKYRDGMMSNLLNMQNLPAVATNLNRREVSSYLNRQNNTIRLLDSIINGLKRDKRADFNMAFRTIKAYNNGDLSDANLKFLNSIGAEIPNTMYNNGTLSSSTAGGQISAMASGDPQEQLKANVASGANAENISHEEADSTLEGLIKTINPSSPFDMILWHSNNVRVDTLRGKASAATNSKLVKATNTLNKAATEHKNRLLNNYVPNGVTAKSDGQTWGADKIKFLSLDKDGYIRVSTNFDNIAEEDQSNFRDYVYSVSHYLNGWAEMNVAAYNASHAKPITKEQWFKTHKSAVMKQCGIFGGFK